MSGDSERENGMYADEVDYDEEDDIIEEDLLMEEVDEDDGIDGEIADEEIEGMRMVVALLHLYRKSFVGPSCLVLMQSLHIK